MGACSALDENAFSGQPRSVGTLYGGMVRLDGLRSGGLSWVRDEAQGVAIPWCWAGARMCVRGGTRMGVGGGAVSQIDLTGVHGLMPVLVSARS